MTPSRSTAQISLGIPSQKIQKKRTTIRAFVQLLQDSYGAFAQYEKLRHMSDPALKRRGISRVGVARALFERMHGKR